MGQVINGMEVEDLEFDEYVYNVDLLETIEDVKAFIKEMGIKLVVPKGHFPADKNKNHWVLTNATPTTV